MAISVGEVEATLKLKDQMSAALNQALGTIKQFASAAKTALGETAAASKAAGDGAKEAAEGFNLLGIAAKIVHDNFGLVLTGGIVGAVSSLFALATSSATAGQELIEMSRKAGVTVEDMEALKFMAEALGGSVETFANSMFMMSKRVEDGGDSVQHGLNKLNIAWVNFRRLKPEEQLLAISDAMRKLPPETNKAQIAVELYGRQGRAMLSQLLEPMRDLYEQGKKQGVWTKEAAEAASKFKLELNILTIEMKKMAAVIGKDMIGSFLEWIEAARKSKIVTELLPGIAHLLADAFKVLFVAAEYLVKVVEWLIAKWDALPPLMKKIATVALLTGAGLWAVGTAANALSSPVQAAVTQLDMFLNVLGNVSTIGADLPDGIMRLGVALEYFTGKQSIANAAAAVSAFMYKSMAMGAVALESAILALANSYVFQGVKMAYATTVQYAKVAADWAAAAASGALTTAMDVLGLSTLATSLRTLLATTQLQSFSIAAWASSLATRAAAAGSIILTGAMTALGIALLAVQWVILPLAAIWAAWQFGKWIYGFTAVRDAILYAKDMLVTWSHAQAMARQEARHLEDQSKKSQEQIENEARAYKQLKDQITGAQAAATIEQLAQVARELREAGKLGRFEMEQLAQQIEITGIAAEKLPPILREIFNTIKGIGAVTLTGKALGDALAEMRKDLAAKKMKPLPVEIGLEVQNMVKAGVPDSDILEQLTKKQGIIGSDLKDTVAATINLKKAEMDAVVGFEKAKIHAARTGLAEQLAIAEAEYQNTKRITSRKQVDDETRRGLEKLDAQAAANARSKILVDADRAMSQRTRTQAFEIALSSPKITETGYVGQLLALDMKEQQQRLVAYEQYATSAKGGGQILQRELTLIEEKGAADRKLINDKAQKENLANMLTMAAQASSIAAGIRNPEQIGKTSTDPIVAQTLAIQQWKERYDDATRTVTERSIYAATQRRDAEIASIRMMENATEEEKQHRITAVTAAAKEEIAIIEGTSADIAGIRAYYSDKSLSSLEKERDSIRRHYDALKNDGTASWGAVDEAFKKADAARRAADDKRSPNIAIIHSLGLDTAGDVQEKIKNLNLSLKTLKGDPNDPNYSAEAVRIIEQAIDALNAKLGGHEMPFMQSLRQFIKTIPETIKSAFTGGGGLLGAVQGIASGGGALIGTHLGQSVVNHFKNAGKLGKAFGGLLSDALPVIGSLAGPMIAAFAKLFDHVPSDLRALARGYGATLSKEMMDGIRKDMKDLGLTEQAATIFNADKLFPKVDTSNLQAAIRITHDALSMVATHQLTMAQGGETIDKMFAKLEKAGTDTYGNIDKSLQQLIIDTRTLGVESQAIEDFLKRQGESGIAAANDMVSGFNDSLAAFEKFKEAMKAGTDVEKNALALKDAAEKSMGELSDLGVIAVDAYAQAVAAGMSPAEALKAAHPALETIRKAYETLGLTVDDVALKTLLMRDKIATASPTLIAAAKGLSGALTSSMNLRTLNVEGFEAIERTGQRTYDRLVNAAMEAGAAFPDAQKLALNELQPYLHQAEKAAKDFGFELDENTRRYIEQSKEAGIWQDAITPEEKLLEGMKDLVQSVKDLIDALRGVPKDVSTSVTTEYKTQYTTTGYPSTPNSGTHADKGGVLIPEPVPVPEPDHVVHGGVVTPTGIFAQPFKTGGLVEKMPQVMWTPSGADVVPAMLAVGERVLTKEQNTEYEQTRRRWVAGGTLEATGGDYESPGATVDTYRTPPGTTDRSADSYRLQPAVVDAYRTAAETYRLPATAVAAYRTDAARTQAAALEMYRAAAKTHGTDETSLGQPTLRAAAAADVYRTADTYLTTPPAVLDTSGVGTYRTPSPAVDTLRTAAAAYRTTEAYRTPPVALEAYRTASDTSRAIAAPRSQPAVDAYRNAADSYRVADAYMAPIHSSYWTPPAFASGALSQNANTGRSLGADTDAYMADIERTPPPMNFDIKLVVNAIDRRGMREAVEKEILPMLIEEIEDRRRGAHTRLRNALR